MCWFVTSFQSCGRYGTGLFGKGRPLAVSQEFRWLIDFLRQMKFIKLIFYLEGYTHTVYSSGGLKISEQTRERVYTASEPSGMFAPVTRVISDGSGRQVFHLHLKSPHCGPHMDVMMGSGKPIGYIQRIGCSLFGGFRLNVCDPDGTVILVIENFDNLWKNHEFFVIYFIYDSNAVHLIELHLTDL